MAQSVQQYRPKIKTKQKHTQTEKNEKELIMSEMSFVLLLWELILQYLKNKEYISEWARHG